MPGTRYQLDEDELGWFVTLPPGWEYEVLQDAMYDLWESYGPLATRSYLIAMSPESRSTITQYFHHSLVSRVGIPVSIITEMADDRIPAVQKGRSIERIANDIGDLYIYQDRTMKENFVRIYDPERFRVERIDRY